MLNLDSAQSLGNLLYYYHHPRPESAGSRLENNLSKPTLQLEL